MSTLPHSLHSSLKRCFRLERLRRGSQRLPNLKLHYHIPFCTLDCFVASLLAMTDIIGALRGVPAEGVAEKTTARMCDTTRGREFGSWLQARIFLESATNSKKEYIHLTILFCNLSRIRKLKIPIRENWYN